MDNFTYMGDLLVFSNINGLSGATTPIFCGLRNINYEVGEALIATVGQ